MAVSAASCACLSDGGLVWFLGLSFNESDTRDDGASGCVSRRENDVSEGAVCPFSSSTSTDELRDLDSKSSLSP